VFCTQGCAGSVGCVKETAIEVYTDPGVIEDVRSALESNGIDVASSETAMVPKTSVALDEKAAEQTLRLVEQLEELEDVQSVYSNSEISDEVAAALAS